MDAEKQVREIVSTSLILTPPTNEPFKVFEGLISLIRNGLGSQQLCKLPPMLLMLRENVHPLEPYCEPSFPGICHIYIFINNNNKLCK